MSSLYEQIGAETLRSVMNDFYDRMFCDPIICFLFAGKDKRALAQKEWEFIGAMLGGSVRYTGRTLKAAHATSLILEGHFYRRVQILEQTLADHKIAMQVREAWIDHTFRLQPQIKHAIIRRLLPKKFEVFVGTPEQREQWKRQGIQTTLKNIWDWVLGKLPECADHTSADIERRLYATLNRVREQLLCFQFDNAVSTMVEFIEYLTDPRQAAKPVSRTTLRALVIALTSFAPRMTEALWELMDEPGLVYLEPYPEFGVRVSKTADEVEETG